MTITKQYVVKGFDGRCELYAHIAGSEWQDNSSTLVIGDTSDDLWWKRALKAKNADGGTDERSTQLSIKHIPPVKTKRGGEVPFSLRHTEQARKLVSVIRESWQTDSPITRLVLYLQDERQKTGLPMVLEQFPDLVVYHLDGEWYDYAPEDDDEDCLVLLGNDPATIWDTLTDIQNEKDLPPVINGIAHEGESTWLGALPKVGKTWVLLCILLALLTGAPLFGDERLTVARKAKRCIYLCPEATRSSIKKRLTMLRLVEHLYDPITNPDGRLFLQTLSKGKKIALTDPVLLELAKGADIFVDTAVRYLEGDENAVKDVRVLTENILNLLAVGARSVWVAHHAPKGFENASTMTLQNMFRGSGEFGAALTNAYGLCTEDEATTKIRLHCICGRDLDEPIPDMILQGRPWLFDTGNFKVVDADAAPRKGGSPGDSEKQLKIDFLRTLTGSNQQKVEQLNAKFGSSHDRSIVSKWLKHSAPFDAEQRRSDGTDCSITTS